MNSLHSHACTHVTPLGNHFTVLNSINDDATIFNLNQVNTPACCNDDYDECNPHDISVLNVPKGTMRFDTNTKSKTSKKNERTHVPLSKELAQTQGLKIGCLNIRGLLSKIDELKMILDECNFDIMGVCETFIDSNVADNEISIDGYSIVKKNRNRHGGGVLLYVKDGIDYSEITELSSEQVESVSGVDLKQNFW